MGDQLYSNQLAIAGLNASMFEMALNQQQPIIGGGDDGGYEDYQVLTEDDSNVETASVTSKKITKLQESLQSAFLKIAALREMHQALSLQLNVTRKSESDINGDFKAALNGLRAEMASVKKVLDKSQRPAATSAASAAAGTVPLPPVSGGSGGSTGDETALLSNAFAFLNENITAALNSLRDDLHENTKFQLLLDLKMTQTRDDLERLASEKVKPLTKSTERTLKLIEDHKKYLGNQRKRIRQIEGEKSCF